MLTIGVGFCSTTTPDMIYLSICLLAYFLIILKNLYSPLIESWII